MLIFPAIDLRDGRVVRLVEGDYDRMTVYGSDPISVAKAYQEKGAEYLHVVDLDAALDGRQKNLEVIGKLAAESGLKLEVGGGVRDEASARHYLDAGVARVILGSAAIERPGFMEDLAKRYPGQVAAGVDARNGFVAIHGWKTITDIAAFDFVNSLPQRGIDTVIYTDISRDGKLQGPNTEAYERLSRIKGLNIVASGGVSTPQDIAALARLKLYAAIIGKALYDGRITLEEAMEAAKDDR
ncbi:MAG: 1-(5-phosphoribosyl)-5-[Clostridia bacterium]|nr:1-(5-phosphoribosyl)-5-[(5-phosphoribosylamino)methylideneamino]imidazole-4-carboxamide isomerase [Clostridia bacterium]